MSIETRIQFDQRPAGMNQALLAGYLQHAESDDTRRSHHFGGRYENVYLTEQQVPELSQLLAFAKQQAAKLLRTDALRYGCWFNYMPPGSTTTRHNHDNEDELLSAVYYVTVPADSGDLLIHDGANTTRITPEAGQLIMFPPDVDHEVTENLGNESRLSIAINFGPAVDE